MKRTGVMLLGLALAASAAMAAAHITVDELACLPNEHNQALTAKVGNVGGGDSVRAHFRRLNPSGAFYFVEMNAAGNDRYWSVLPRPEDRRQRQLTDEWWDVLKERDWIDSRSRDEIEDWLEDLEHEAAEYFVAVYSPTGERLSRSEEFVVEVLDDEDCEADLTPVEVGFSRNLTVGETTQAQVGEPVFHWLCEGIVTRLSASGILRADEFCRACVVATWFPATAAAAALVTGTTIIKREPRRASPVLPER